MPWSIEVQNSISIPESCQLKLDKIIKCHVLKSVKEQLKMVSKKLPHKSESGEKIAKMKLVIQEQEKLKWGKVFQVNIISLQNEHSY